MYRSFKIQNFRGLKNLSIEGLGRVNLITGANNVGKTALLEALWIHHGAVIPELGLRVDSFRGLDPGDSEDFMGSLFFGYDRGLEIELAAKGDWGKEPRRLKMSLEDRATVEVPVPALGPSQPATQTTYSRNQLIMNYSYESRGQATSAGWLVQRQTNSMVPGAPGVTAVGMEARQAPRPHDPLAIFLTARRASISEEDVKRYSDLEVRGQHKGAVQILKGIDPRLTKLAVVSARPTPAIYADIGLSRLIPMQLMGDGMARILSLALSIATVPGGMVLVDEIENGLHHLVMQKVWSSIATFARHYNVQIFATTHSRECFQAALEALGDDDENEFRLYRIEHFRDKLRTVRYDREMMDFALNFNVEVR
jgi:hypothetical protein